MREIVLVDCADEVGLIHRITGVLQACRLNIESNQEFVDTAARHFFLRAEVMPAGGPVPAERLAAELAAVLRGDGPWTDLAGSPLTMTASEPMWNSGVVGVDPADRRLIDEAIHLTDQLCSRLRMHTLEQFALGIVLGRATRLREALDVVFHYWDRAFRDPFHEQLPQLLAQHASLPLAERARRCHACRPRPTVRSRVRTRVTRWLRTVGLRPPLERRSE